MSKASLPLRRSSPGLRQDLVTVLCETLQGHPFWGPCLYRIRSQSEAPAVHLAVMVEPYLGLVLEGRKTIESRFSVHRIAPYRRASPGDVLLLKRAGGPLLGLCQVQAVWFYRLDPQSWREIRKEFTDALCAQDPAFWEQRRRAAFASLMRIGQVQKLPSLAYEKHDRRGWVVLQEPRRQGSFPFGGNRGLDVSYTTNPNSTKAMTAGIRLGRVVVISGGIASGKSTVARNIAARLGYIPVSFGALVQRRAIEQGLPVSREVLQDLGAQMISSMGPPGLVHAALDQAGVPGGGHVVFDGVRHVSVLAGIRAIAEEAICVFLSLDQRLRHQRFVLKDPSSPPISLDEFAAFDGHPVEAETSELKPLADLVVDATTSVETVCDRILEALASRPERSAALLPIPPTRGSPGIRGRGGAPPRGTRRPDE